MALTQDYHELWFTSFELASTSGHIDHVALKLVPGQALPEEVASACNDRCLDPFELLLECNKDLFYRYMLGTRFLLRAKLTDRSGKGTFFYTSYRWPPIEVVIPSAASRKIGTRSVTGARSNNMCPSCSALLVNPSQRGAHLPLPGIRTTQLRNLWGDVTCPQCGAEWTKWSMQPWHLVRAPTAKPPPAKRTKRK